MPTLAPMKPPRLSAAELDAARAALPGWSVAADRLQRGFRFADFNAAWGFMSRVALLAEQQDHHPDWSNSWNRVEIALTTHAAGGVTARDVTLARSIDSLATGLVDSLATGLVDALG